jgi:mRNA-degrading endonuclease toxin of MazEF toxin-antitoxin module
VGVSDKRYPETIQVQLFKGNNQGGFDQVGTLTQSIPMTTGKSSTTFAFSYTFTPGDAVVGKVTFEAIATIQTARDALPADNTAIASTTVN